MILKFLKLEIIESEYNVKRVEKRLSCYVLFSSTHTHLTKSSLPPSAHDERVSIIKKRKECKHSYCGECRTVNDASVYCCGGAINVRNLTLSHKSNRTLWVSIQNPIIPLHQL